MELRARLERDHMKRGEAAGFADRELLERALAGANLPTLVAICFQLTGDESFLCDRFAASKPRGQGPNDGGGYPDAVAAEIRNRAAEALTKWAAGKPAAVPAPDREVLLRLAKLVTGEDVPEPYVRLLSSELTERMEAAPRPDPARIRPAAHRAIIIGAGVSGLAAAVELDRIGVPYTILERSPDVGGVWLVNKYPGAGVDTPSYLYSFSSFPRNFATHFAKRDEMVRYLRDMADHFAIYPRIKFGCTVTAAHYDEDRACWTVHFTHPDGTRDTVSASVLISAVGLFNKPKRSAIEGTERFRGQVIHTADWPSGLSLEGKRVAVVGTGASAMQVVPAIADRVRSLTVFQRSPQWIAPNEEYFKPVSPEMQWLMQHAPYYYAWYRFRLAWVFNDRVHPSLVMDPEWPHPGRSLNAVNDRHRAFFTRYLHQQLQGRPDLVSKCLPTYPPFGKRMLLDNGWFEALKKPNVHLVTEAVASLAEDGVVTASGTTVNADVVVTSTGFEVTNFLRSIDVRGAGGRRLQDQWEPDDASAYLGIAIPGFPNLFLMYGPNTNSGAGGSLIFIAEAQAHYIRRVVEQMEQAGLAAVECRQRYLEDWVREVDTAHARMIWSHPGMTTYYRNGRGRIVTNTPLKIIDYWQRTREPDFSAFEATPREQ